MFLKIFLCKSKQKKIIRENDPYAGSPTKTLLRLFLPTNEKI